jgi:hypothetical protein
VREWLVLVCVVMSGTCMPACWRNCHPVVPAWNHISFPLSLQLLEDTNQVCMV